MEASSSPKPVLRSRRRLSAARWVLILIALNLAWRTLRYLLDFPMWGDEAFVAVNFFDRGFAGMMEPLEHRMVVPVGFMWLNLLASKMLGLSELALRFLPFLAGLLSMLLFAMLSRRMLDRRSALLAIAIFAASYYPIRHATEVKPYSFDLLMALCVLWPTWWVWERPESLKRWCAMALVCAAVVWCSYPVVFVAGGALAFLSLAVLQRRSIRITSIWLVSGLLLVGSFIAMYRLVGVQQAQITEQYVASNTWSESFPPFGEPLKLLLWVLDVHTGNMFAYPAGGRQGGSTLTFLMVVFGCFALLKRHRPLLLLLIAPFALSFIAAALQKYPYGGSARVSQHLAPSICLLAGPGLMAMLRMIWPPRKAIEAWRFAPVVMVVLILIGVGIDIAKPYKKPSDALCRETARSIASRVDPDDRFIVFGKFGEQPGVPDLLNYGGSAARLRYDLLYYTPIEVHWGPDPNRLILGFNAGDPDASIWLLEYRDNKIPFPFDQFESYRQPFLERFGEPKTLTFDLHDRGETIILHRYRRSTN